MTLVENFLHFPDRFGGGGEGWPLGSTQAVSLTAFSEFFFYAFPLYRIGKYIFQETKTCNNIQTKTCQPHSWVNPLPLPLPYSAVYDALARFKTSQQFIPITLHEAWQVESPLKAPQSWQNLPPVLLWVLLGACIFCPPSIISQSLV